MRLQGPDPKFASMCSFPGSANTGHNTHAAFDGQQPRDNSVEAAGEAGKKQTNFCRRDGLGSFVEKCDFRHADRRNDAAYCRWLCLFPAFIRMQWRDTACYELCGQVGGADDILLLAKLVRLKVKLWMSHLQRPQRLFSPVADLVEHGI
jgi:hypothetical protein